MKSFFLLLFIAAASQLFSQSIENVDFRASGKTIVVSYDFLHPKADTAINVALVFKDQQGVSIVPKAISGDIKNVKPGEGKRIIWDVMADGITLSGKYIAIVESLKFTKSIIGSQAWMSENLNEGRFRNGDLILQVKNLKEMEDASNQKIPAWCFLNFDPKNGEKYGKLYNWYAVIDKRGLAPEGWHISADSEWSKLISFFKGKDACIHLKSENDWFRLKSYNGNGLNTFGFSLLPSGANWLGDNQNEQEFNSHKYSYFWSSTNATDSTAWGMHFSFYATKCYKYDYFKNFYLSVRCVQDDTINNFHQNLNNTYYLDSILNLPANSVYIGSKIWMDVNLNVDCFQNGDPIPEAKTDIEWEKAGNNRQPAWCYYNNDPKNGAKFGKLYNWYAVNDPRGLAPKGWHIPTAEEWRIITAFLDLDFDSGYNLSGLKLKKLSEWSREYAINRIQDSEDNTLGFNAVPSGFRSSYGEFPRFRIPDPGDGSISRNYSDADPVMNLVDLSFVGWWSMTSIDALNAIYRSFQHTHDLEENEGRKGEGLSVRCIKD